MDARERRLGANEVLFREVNERLAGMGGSPITPELPHDFVCECANPDCDARIALTLAEYERVRADPTHFAIHPGHQVPEVEAVVAENERFDVVRKHEGEPAELATEYDPRS
jgi:hypothetical protein